MQLRLHSAALQEALDDVGPIEVAMATQSAATTEVGFAGSLSKHSMAPLHTRIALMLPCMRRHRLSTGACWPRSAPLQSIR
jgi:hypothetical protein